MAYPDRSCYPTGTVTRKYGSGSEVGSHGEVCDAGCGKDDDAYVVESASSVGTLTREEEH